MTIIPLPSLLLLFFLLPFYVISQPATNKNDQDTLLKLKQFWSNPPSINHWNQSSNPCTWPEITCTAATVTGITIPNKNITGNFPPFICDIKNLTHLDLNYNYISGSFPTALYNCTNLRYLDLSQNYFAGRLPDDISRLSSELQYLSLAGNSYTGDIPVNISRLSKLSVLHLEMNYFNGSFPVEIGYMNDLEELYLGFNPYIPSRVHQSYFQMKKLRIFFMTEAYLIGELPGNLSGVPEMQQLDLSVNNITGSIPTDLFMLKNLTQIFLYGNNLTGEIPQTVESLNLEIIDLSTNKLTGKIPEGFGNLMNLWNLSLMINQLTGELPTSIGRLPNLYDIRIFKNNLSGEIPPDFGRYSVLKIFDITDNNFTGNLPENLCYYGQLKGLEVLNNNLSGEIPKSLGNCSSLKSFQVNGNRFWGSIPDGLWNGSRLERVVISGNMFSGELPAKLGPILSRLDVSNNNFSGQIPTGVSSWTSLRDFKASYNLFHGAIPQELTALPDLVTLMLDGNQFSGDIPASVVSWSSLSNLNLSRNQLTGPIPVGLGFLKSLTSLDLSRNNLTGKIPSQLLGSVVTLDLSSNNLTGTIPSQFDSGAFDQSFLNNPGLCSNNPSLGLSVCGSQTETRSSKKISTKFVVVIASIAVVLFVLAILMARYVIVHYRRRNDDLNWKFTSFQKLSFTESTILPRLTENNVIGHGGSGKVYRVQINRSGEFVVVKKISCKKDIDQRLEKEFLSEVEILSTIRHSNIVKLLGCISSDYSKLLVYEYLENRSLDRWLHGKRAPSSHGFNGSVRHMVLDWPKRLHIALGVARGLCYMHDDCVPAIIHRDVKSSNVLLDSDFNAKIADFGLARMLAKDSELMSTVAGSFGYMAPEYANTTRVNEKIDVYSFGVILLELTTGKEASDGNENLSLAEWAWQRALNGSPIVDALDNEVNEPRYVNDMTNVFKLGLWCTSKLVTDRPSMQEVCQMLLRCSVTSAVKTEAEKNGGDVADHSPLLKLDNV